jgi:hypothetical protein
VQSAEYHDVELDEEVLRRIDTIAAVWDCTFEQALSVLLLMAVKQVERKMYIDNGSQEEV